MMKVFLYFGLAICSLVGLILATFGLAVATTPRPTDIKGCFTTKMYEVRLCPTENSYVKIKDISAYVKAAVIASEDTTFYTHKGVDWDELKASFERNMERGTYARGGSTITQQLAKNLYLSSEKSLWRKFKEVIITVQIEKVLSKDEILEKYLNVVEFGPNIFGVKKAAEFYFAKSPSQLSVLEGTFLAFVLPSPKKYSASFRNKTLTKFANSQMKAILGRLLGFKKISQEEYDTAMAGLPYLFSGTPPATPESDEVFETEELDELEPLEEI